MEQSTYNKLLIEWANDHYWDSLEKDKDLILKHLRNFGNINRGGLMIERVIAKCEEEIDWAQANIDEMNLPGNPHDYKDDDREWFPCWLRAHKAMLKFIAEEG